MKLEQIMNLFHELVGFHLPRILKHSNNYGRGELSWPISVQAELR